MDVPWLGRVRGGGKGGLRVSSLSTLMTLCTIGISLSATLKTTISPARNGVKPMCKNKMSPRWKAGSMLPLSTTTTGDSDSVITISPCVSACEECNSEGVLTHGLTMERTDISIRERESKRHQREQ